jgi:hypothetical protein
VQRQAPALTLRSTRPSGRRSPRTIARSSRTITTTTRSR